MSLIVCVQQNTTYNTGVTVHLKTLFTLGKANCQNSPFYVYICVLSLIAIITNYTAISINVVGSKLKA